MSDIVNTVRPSSIEWPFWISTDAARELDYLAENIWMHEQHKRDPGGAFLGGVLKGREAKDLDEDMERLISLTHDLLKQHRKVFSKWPDFMHLENAMKEASESVLRETEQFDADAYPLFGYEDLGDEAAYLKWFQADFSQHLADIMLLGMQRRAHFVRKYIREDDETTAGGFRPTGGRPAHDAKKNLVAEVIRVYVADGHSLKSKAAKGRVYELVGLLWSDSEDIPSNRMIDDIRKSFTLK